MISKVINYNNYLDKDNYLIEFSAWNYNIANFIAFRENVVLTDKHFFLIDILREFYIRNKIYPNSRIIISIFKKKNELKFIDSGYINLLFPGNSVNKLIKISGLPNFNNCI